MAIFLAGGIVANGKEQAKTGTSFLYDIDGFAFQFDSIYKRKFVKNVPFFLGGLDLAFLVDASSNIGGEANFRLVLNFVSNVFHSFAHARRVRYGLVVFADSIKVSKGNFLKVIQCLDKIFLWISLSMCVKQRLTCHWRKVARTVEAYPGFNGTK